MKVNEADDDNRFRTLRGSLTGSEPDEVNYFAYSASLRIFGNIPDLGEITRQLCVDPTSSHRRGERKGTKFAPYRHDMWSYTAPIPETEPLQVHIDTLWNTFRQHREYLLQLKRSLRVDVFLGYSSNCDNAGVEVPYQSLEIFRELEVPFGLSIIVT